MTQQGTEQVMNWVLPREQEIQITEGTLRGKEHSYPQLKFWSWQPARSVFQRFLKPGCNIRCEALRQIRWRWASKGCLRKIRILTSVAPWMFRVGSEDKHPWAREASAADGSLGVVGYLGRQGRALGGAGGGLLPGNSIRYDFSILEAIGKCFLKGEGWREMNGYEHQFSSDALHKRGAKSLFYPLRSARSRRWPCWDAWEPHSHLIVAGTINLLGCLQLDVQRVWFIH